MKFQAAKKIGILFLFFYVISVVIAQVFFVMVARFSCVKSDGWSGFFWCSDSIIGAFITAFFKAIIWPILFVRWILS
jgi:hypothetical protein